MLSSPQTFRLKVSCWFIHFASVDSPRRVREILVPHGRNTTQAPWPWPSRAVGHPMFLHGSTYQHDVGAQLISLLVLIGPRPLPSRCLSPRLLDKHGNGIVIKRSDRWVWYGTPGDLGSGNPAFTISCGSCNGLLATTLWPHRALRACYCPLCLSTSGKLLTQRTSR